MRKAFWLIVAVLMVTGCDARGQTPADHRAALKSFLDSQPDSAVPTLENAWKPYGYVAPGTDPPPPPDKQVIFATTLETGNYGPLGMGDFGKNTSPQYWNSGTGKTEILQVSNAHSGMWVAKCSVSGSGVNGSRIFVQDDWRTGKRVNLPNECWTDEYVKIPTQLNAQWILCTGWKQTTASRRYVDVTVNTFFSGSTDYLALAIKGDKPGASTGDVPPTVINQPTATRKLFPKNTWVRLQTHVKHSTGTDGIYEVWQDGTLILQYKGKTSRTGFDGPAKYECEICTCYGPNFTGAIYYDDVSVSSLK